MKKLAVFFFIYSALLLKSKRLNHANNYLSTKLHLLFFILTQQLIIIKQNFYTPQTKETKTRSKNDDISINPLFFFAPYASSTENKISTFKLLM